MELTKTAVVVNPASGNGATGKKWPDIEAALKKEGFEFEYCFTKGPGHAETLTRQFIKDGNELIISVGGDGTVNEVVNGFFCDGELLNPKASLAFIPKGTGCDLGRTIGIPTDYKAAVRHIKNCPARQIDIGKATYTANHGAEESRYFVNIAGLGLDGDTVDRVNRTSKVMGGFGSFLWGTLISLLLYKNKKMTITVDGEVVCDEPVTVVVVGNGRFFGGGMLVAPHALVDDGFFDIIILRNMSKCCLLMNLPGVYKGNHLNHQQVISLRGRKIFVNSDQKALIDLDGEQPGYDPAAFEILPLALRLFG